MAESWFWTQNSPAELTEHMCSGMASACCTAAACSPISCILKQCVKLCSIHDGQTTTVPGYSCSRGSVTVTGMVDSDKSSRKAQRSCNHMYQTSSAGALRQLMRCVLTITPAEKVTLVRADTLCDCPYIYTITLLRTCMHVRTHTLGVCPTLGACCFL